MIVGDVSDSECGRRVVEYYRKTNRVARSTDYFWFRLKPAVGDV